MLNTSPHSVTNLQRDTEAAVHTLKVNITVARLFQQLHSHFNVLWLLKPLRNLTLNFLFVRDEHNFKPFIQRPQREAYVSENS